MLNSCRKSSSSHAEQGSVAVIL